MRNVAVNNYQLIFRIAILSILAQASVPSLAQKSPRTDRYALSEIQFTTDSFIPLTRVVGINSSIPVCVLEPLVARVGKSEKNSESINAYLSKVQYVPSPEKFAIVQARGRKGTLLITTSPTVVVTPNGSSPKVFGDSRCGMPNELFFIRTSSSKLDLKFVGGWNRKGIDPACKNDPFAFEIASKAQREKKVDVSSYPRISLKKLVNVNSSGTRICIVLDSRSTSTNSYSVALVREGSSEGLYLIFFGGFHGGIEYGYGPINK